MYTLTQCNFIKIFCIYSWITNKWVSEYMWKCLKQSISATLERLQIMKIHKWKRDLGDFIWNFYVKKISFRAAAVFYEILVNYFNYLGIFTAYSSDKPANFQRQGQVDWNNSHLQPAYVQLLTFSFVIKYKPSPAT